LKNYSRKWFFKEPWFEGSLKYLYRFFEELFKGHGSLKNSGLKGSLWNQKWCLQEPFPEGSLRHLYRLFEELFKGHGSFKNPGLKGSFMQKKKTTCRYEVLSPLFLHNLADKRFCTSTIDIIHILNDIIYNLKLHFNESRTENG